MLPTDTRPFQASRSGPSIADQHRHVNIEKSRPCTGAPQPRAADVKGAEGVEQRQLVRHGHVAARKFQLGKGTIMASIQPKPWERSRPSRLPGTWSP
jgi:hypothetical protein